MSSLLTRRSFFALAGGAAAKQPSTTTLLRAQVNSLESAQRALHQDVSDLAQRLTSLQNAYASHNHQYIYYRADQLEFGFTQRPT